MDPTHRLDRLTAGQWLHEPRSLESRLHGRDRELRPPRSVVGEDARVPAHEVRRTRNWVDPHPNAPQLIRLVRYPFALHASRPVRADGRDPVPWHELRREHRPRFSAVLGEARRHPVVGNPLRAWPTRLAPRPRPAGVQAWLDSRSTP